MAWVDLSGAFGYGTKLTSTQQQNLRDNIAAMAAGDAGAPEIVEAALGASAVAQAKLKTDTGEVTQAETPLNLVLPGGEYGFYPQTKVLAGDEMAFAIGAFFDFTAWRTNIYMDPAAGERGYAQQRYVTSSGEVYWIFILRRIDDQKIISMYCAADHPCFGNGGKPALVPHPFGKYDPEKYEIIVINPSKEEVKALKKATIVEDEEQPNKALCDIILEKYEIDELSNPIWPDKEVTVGLPPDWDEAWISGQPVQPIKKVIPKPDYVLCKSLKLKSGKAL